MLICLKFYLLVAKVAPHPSKDLVFHHLFRSYVRLLEMIVSERVSSPVAGPLLEPLVGVLRSEAQAGTIPSERDMAFRIHLNIRPIPSLRPTV